MTKRVVLALSVCSFLGVVSSGRDARGEPAPSAACAEDGYSIGFFNGVWNTKTQANRSLRAIQRLLGERYSDGAPLEYDLFYNTSVSNLADLAEVFEQRAIEQRSVLNARQEVYWEILTGNTGPGSLLGTMIQAIPALRSVVQARIDEFTTRGASALAGYFRDSPTTQDYARHRAQIDGHIEAGKKLLLVGHSQGSLFVNVAYDHATTQASTDLIQAVYVAPANASATIRGGRYTLSENDRVINALRTEIQRLRILGDVADSNVIVPVRPVDLTGHTFQRTYLAQGEEAYPRVVGHWFSALATLSFGDVAASCLVDSGSGCVDFASASADDIRAVCGDAPVRQGTVCDPRDSQGSCVLESGAQRTTYYSDDWWLPGECRRQGGVWCSDGEVPDVPPELCDVGDVVGSCASGIDVCTDFGGAVDAEGIAALCSADSLISDSACDTTESVGSCVSQIGEALVRDNFFSDEASGEQACAQRGGAWCPPTGTGGEGGSGNMPGTGGSSIGGNGGMSGSGAGGSGGTGGTMPGVPEPPGNEGTSRGDPHLRTFDGLVYDCQAVGEFTLLRDEGDGLEVQVRTQPWGASASGNVATAARIGADRLGLYGDGTVRLNGETVVLEEGRSALPDGGEVWRGGESYALVWPDNTQLRTTLGGEFIHVDAFLPDARRRGSVSGLLGDFDDDPEDDVRIRGGEALASPAPFARFYGEFAESWRVVQEASLFDYEPGEDTETFTDRSFPPELATTESLSSDARGAATTICEAASVDEAWLDACVLDVALTGDTAIAGVLAGAPPVLATFMVEPPEDTEGCPAAMPASTACSGRGRCDYGSVHCNCIGGFWRCCDINAEAEFAPEGSLCATPDCSFDLNVIDGYDYTCNGTYPDCNCDGPAVAAPAPTACTSHAECPGGLCYGSSTCGGGKCREWTGCIGTANYCGCSDDAPYPTSCEAMSAGNISAYRGDCTGQ